MNKVAWILWGVLTVGLASYFLYTLLLSDDKSDFIVGEASHGHHQIEMACDTCHTNAFGAGEVLQDACENCHAEELRQARDSHPKKKFNDPRNADLLEIIDARYCVSCHVEHQAERTLEIGLTLPKDYCYHCHETVGEERASHADLAFDSCASSGCHNFHDNLALYEDFLVGNHGKPWLSEQPKSFMSSHAKLLAPKGTSSFPQLVAEKSQQHSEVQAHWALSGHAQASVGCDSCHVQGNQAEWVTKPGIEQCQSCHEQEVAGFTEGKHGMRLSAKLSKPLSPMKPALGRLDFHQEALHSELTCNSCHDVHSLNTQKAAQQSCIGCHADEHSQAFETSPHGQLWQKVEAGELPAEQGVSCATCHMPAIEDSVNGVKSIRVQHNQNGNLRPNEKMIRPVCMQCHSLEFSIDALADKALIESNFNGKPSTHIESVDWAVKRAKR